MYTTDQEEMRQQKEVVGMDPYKTDQLRHCHTIDGQSSTAASEDGIPSAEIYL